jgi:hypothetical protein
VKRWPWPWQKAQEILNDRSHAQHVNHVYGGTVAIIYIIAVDSCRRSTTSAILSTTLTAAPFYLRIWRALVTWGLGTGQKFFFACSTNVRCWWCLFFGWWDRRILFAHLLLHRFQLLWVTDSHIKFNVRIITKGRVLRMESSKLLYTVLFRA